MKKRAKLIDATGVLLCLLFGVVDQASATSLFQIGNSLTWDSQPERTELMATSVEVTLEIGHHIRCNSTLNEIWSNPNSTCVSPDPSTFQGALVGQHWDAVTLQPFDKGLSTFGQDLDRVHDFIDVAESEAASPSTKWYIYAAFPPRESWEQWEQPFGGALADRTIHSESYFETLYGHLDQVYPGRIGMVPIGHVLSRLRLAIEAGAVPGIDSIRQLYRDDVHLSYSAGRFLASTTVFATITGESPVGVPVPRQGYSNWNTDRLPDELAAVIQEVVWDVVSTHPRAGVANQIAGDYNQDGSVDYEDLTYWRSTYESEYLFGADANDDGVVNAADYTVWRDGLAAAQAAGASVGVPEPNAALSLTFAAGSLFFRRRV